MSEIERIYLTAANKAVRWPDVLRFIKQWIEQGVRITIEPKTESRKAVQNRLYWRWAGQWAERKGELVEEVHGAWKKDLLLPLKLADEKEHDRAVREQTYIRGMVAMVMAMDFEDEDEDFIPPTPRELSIDAAVDVVRSRDIGVRLFAQWLTQIQQTAAQEGLQLTSRQDDLDIAL